MNQIHEVFPGLQPILSLHLMNGNSKHPVCKKHMYYYGNCIKKLRSSQ